MSFQAKDPRDLVKTNVRIPRKTRDKIIAEARRLQITDSELHRRALAIGLKAIAAEPTAA